MDWTSFLTNGNDTAQVGELGSAGAGVFVTRPIPTYRPTAGRAKLLSRIVRRQAILILVSNQRIDFVSRRVHLGGLMNRRTADLVLIGLLIAFGLGFTIGYAPQHLRIARQAACMAQVEAMSGALPIYSRPIIDNFGPKVKWTLAKKKFLDWELVTDFYFQDLIMNLQECDSASGLATITRGAADKWLGAPSKWMVAHYGMP